MNLVLAAKKQKIRELTIYVETGRGSCPFACTYCFVAKRGEHRVMTRQTLMDCVDFLRRVCEKPKALRFFGTEPLTQFGLIQHARAYAPDLEISITTNGWLLNDERIQWLADNDVRIYVYSIDGGPEHHKARRTQMVGKHGNVSRERLLREAGGLPRGRALTMEITTLWDASRHLKR